MDTLLQQKKTVAKQNHKIMVRQFQILVTEYDLNGSISRKINGGNTQSFNRKNLAFDCPAFQHHFKEIKSPSATSVERGKDQDNQAWGGTCCNYGKVGYLSCCILDMYLSCQQLTAHSRSLSSQ